MLIKLDIRLNRVTNDNGNETSPISALIVSENKFYCANS